MGILRPHWQVYEETERFWLLLSCYSNVCSPALSFECSCTVYCWRMHRRGHTSTRMAVTQTIFNRNPSPRECSYFRGTFIYYVIKEGGGGRGSDDVWWWGEGGLLTWWHHHSICANSLTASTVWLTPRRLVVTVIYFTSLFVDQICVQWRQCWCKTI